MTPKRFNPTNLSELLRYRKDKSEKPPLSVLFGAGFSCSAGIPLASTMISEIKEMGHPSIINASPVPKGISEYNHLMGLLTAKDRSDFVKDQIRKGRCEKTGLMTLNWAHLFLGLLVYRNYINLLLTPNFDPIMTEALAFVGMPSQSFDLNAARSYQSGILDPGSVVYLHGQMHSLFIANDNVELEKASRHYEGLLGDVVRDSTLLIVGYSGECDPIIKALLSVPTFTHDIYWVQFDEGEPKGDGLKELISAHSNEFHFCSGIDADQFMTEFAMPLVKEELPEAISKPLHAPLQSLGRILPFPDSSSLHKSDPVVAARQRLEQAIEQENSPDSDKTNPGSSPSKHLQIELASFTQDPQKIEKAIAGITPDPSSVLSQAAGSALLRAASGLFKNKPKEALDILSRAEEFGLEPADDGWLFNLQGTALGTLAALKAPSEEADSLYQQAFEKYQDAISIKPDMHEAFNNWGDALGNLAALKAPSEEANSLYQQAFDKFQKSISIKPDKHEAFYNWGTDLGNLAALKAPSKEADSLYQQAFEKFQEAISIKPDKHEAFFNEACCASLQGDLSHAIRALESWKKNHPSPTKKKLDNDSDFDNIRASPEFQALFATLS